MTTRPDNLPPGMGCAVILVLCVLFALSLWAFTRYLEAGK